jgi:hypothetical protein
MSEMLGEHEFEPVRGLPGHLPAGETLLWQGEPSWRKLAIQVFHVRAVALYFALIALWRLVVGISDGVAPVAIVQGIAVLVLMAAIVIGLLVGYAVLIERTTVYTITDRRVVIRGGVALSKSWNLPFTILRSAAVREDRDGGGDVSLELAEGNRIAYLMLWPYARPWSLRHPQPLLRGLAEVDPVARIVASALVNAGRSGPAKGRAARTAADRARPTATGIATG